jgi:hypothetical protein
MNNPYLVFAVFSVLVSVLLFGIWSNIHVYAQQQSSSSQPASSSFSTRTISPELKAKVCDPGNPSLKVVNTTESRICGIPKTVKPPSLAAATQPTTSAVSSSKQQLTTTAPRSVANISASKQQQQITTTNDNNALVRSTSAATKGLTIAPASNLSNKSLSSQSIIAPQINAIDKLGQGQQQPQLLPISNSTELQNYTFASISPFTDPGKLMYLGFHGGLIGKSSSTSSNSDSTNNNHNSNRDISSKHTDNSKTESSKHRSDSNTHDSSSEKKKKTTHNSKSSSSNSDDSKSHKDKTSHGSKSSSGKNDGKKSSSDFGSAIRKKVNSIIKKALG